MAIMSSHGGSCCGMRHISGFRHDPETNATELITKTNNTEYGDGRYQLEVILSDRQTRENPDLVAELARLGYVYTSSWTGQHGTPVHLFLRAKRRLGLTAANFYNRWVNDLNGMLPHPALEGVLPPLNEQGVNRQNNPDRPYYFNFLAVGDRVRINSPRSRYNETEQVILRFQYSGVTDRYYALFHDLPAGAQIVVTNLVQVERQAPAAAPVVAPTVYRHPNAANVAFAPEVERPVVPAAPERRLILSQFYCVFRATNQASRVFDTLAEAQAAYPQALDWHERKVYSDGQVGEGPVQHG